MATGDRSQFARALKAAEDVVTFDELVEGVLEPMRVGAGCSGTLLYRYDNDGQVGHLGGSLVEVTPHYATELFHQDPIQRALFERKHMPHAVVPRLFPEIEWKKYRRGAAYNEFYGPSGVDDMLGLTLTDRPYGTPHMAGLVLTRAANEPPFEAELVRQVDRLRKILVSTVRRIERFLGLQRRHAMLEAVLDQLTSHPLIITDAAGRLVHASEEADGLLGVEAARNLESIALSASLASDRRVQGSIAGRHGPLLAESFVVYGNRGEAFVATTFQKQKPQTPGAAITRWGLTRAERAVVALLREGLSNREIAGRLFVSVETVRTHVHHVLSKVGVRSRTQLLVLLTKGGYE